MPDIRRVSMPSHKVNGKFGHLGHTDPVMGSTTSSIAESLGQPLAACSFPSLQARSYR